MRRQAPIRWKFPVNQSAQREEILRCPICRNGRSARHRGRKRPATLHAQWRAFPGDETHRWQAGYSCQRRHNRLLMSDAKQAEAWHNAGVANGGTSIEDLPGVRANGAYLAYLRDPPMTTSSLGSPGLIADSKKLRRAVLSKLTPIFRCSKSPFP